MTNVSISLNRLTMNNHCSEYGVDK